MVALTRERDECKLILKKYDQIFQDSQEVLDTLKGKNTSERTEYLNSYVISTSCLFLLSCSLFCNTCFNNSSTFYGITAGYDKDRYTLIHFSGEVKSIEQKESSLKNKLKTLGVPHSALLSVSI